MMTTFSMHNSAHSKPQLSAWDAGKVGLLMLVKCFKIFSHKKSKMKQLLFNELEILSSRSQ